MRYDAYDAEELKKLHQIELKILQEIIRICTEHDITYFTVGGTTLGALRHNGFIPWDDDIDIGMMRDDYERFLSIAPQALQDGFTLQHFKTDSNTPTYFAKVRKDGTEFIEKHSKNVLMHQGVFIDIMPYDAVPEDGRVRKGYYRSAALWTQLYIAKTLWVASYTQSKIKKLLFSAVRSALHVLLLPVPKSYLFHRLDSVMRAYNQTSSPMVSSKGLPVFTCDQKDLIPVQMHQFESLTVAIPANSERVLQIQYGDWNQLPPENQRINHAPYRLNI